MSCQRYQQNVKNSQLLTKPFLLTNDRNAFFEELWFILKTNLATHELNIIFHDLKEPTEKQKEKGAKSQLCYSFVSGKKTPQIFDGKEKEDDDN